MIDRTTAFVRLFCVWCAAAVLPLLPVAMATITSMRQHPIALDGSRVRGSSVVTRDGRTIDAMRIGNGAWISASSPEARRRFRNIPAGTTIAYVLHDGREVGGAVSTVRADAATIVRRAVLALLAVVCTISGLALGLAALNRAALAAGGFLAAAGATFGFRLLEPNVVLIASPALRDAAIVAFVLVPAGLWCRYLLLLATEFPAALHVRRFERAAIAFVSVAAIANALLLALAQAGAVFDRLPHAIARLILALLESDALQVVPALIAAVVTITLIARQARSAVDGDRGRRARIVAWGCAFGIGIPVAALLVQAIAWLATHHLLMPRAVMSLLLAPLALIPASLTYALLARRVERIGVLARRAVIFAIAARTITIGAATPLAALLVVAYVHRREALAANLPLVGTLLVCATLMLLFARPLHDALERLFFRDALRGRALLTELASRVRVAADPRELTQLVKDGIDDALHVETIELVIFNQGWTSQLDAISGAADVDDTLLAQMSEVDRQWLTSRRLRLLVPLRRGDGTLLALLGIGDAMSGLPFVRETRMQLAAVAASAAATLENFELRSMRTATASRGDTALLCATCGSVSDPLAATRCAADGTPLVDAGVPHVLSGKFRIEQRLGAGAMGVVWRARDLLLARDVAIKSLPALPDDEVRRFAQEARIAAALSHPAIATIFAAETWEARPMLVFELLEGGTLAARLPLSAHEIASIGAALSDGLAHAHAAGVLHRDIKPSNVGFTRDGAPKLLDFGLAQFAADTTHGVAGTAAYLSPDLILGEPASPRDDVWSLAVTLYEALTGANPFTATSTTLTLNAILSRDVADPRALRGDVPEPLAMTLLAALQRRRAERITTAVALRDSLRCAIAREIA